MRLLLSSSALVAVAATLFLVLTTTNAFQQQQQRRQSATTKLFGGSSGFATTTEGKKATVDKIRTLLDESSMIFSTPADRLTVAESQTLRRSVAKAGGSVAVVKNTLMKNAVSGTDFEIVSDDGSAHLLKGSNMWFFVKDDDSIGSVIGAYKDFSKSEGKKETHPFLGGVLESTLYDTAGVDAIGNLPSKKELYAKIAAGVKAVPTKVARVVRAPGAKVARAISLATKADGEGGDSE